MTDTERTAAQKPRNTTEHVYELLKEKIFDRRLLPMQKINIDQLARDMGVSAIPLREGLSRLLADKLVTFEPFKGYRVSNVLDNPSFTALLEARLLIELHAIRHIIRNNQSHIIYEISELNEQMKNLEVGLSYREYLGFNQLDHQFHNLLVKGGGNPFLVEAYEGMHCHLHLARLYQRRGSVDHREGIEEHQEIIEAMRTRDLLRSEKAITEHIEGAKMRLSSSN